MGGRVKCEACQRLILLLECRDGRTRSFQPDPVALVEDPLRTGFVILAARSQGRLVRVAAVPVRDVADRRLDPGRTNVFHLHFCTEWAERAMRVDLADLQAALAGGPLPGDRRRRRRS